MKNEEQENQDDLDNTANQLNSNNEAYWQSRGYKERPENWEKLLAEIQKDKIKNPTPNGAKNSKGKTPPKKS